MKRGLQLSTFTPCKPFVKQLATWVFEQYADTPEILTKCLILVPNQRSVGSLQDALLEVSGGKALLLPKIQPIGELEDGGVFTSLPLEHLTKTQEDFPSAISPIRRLLLLARLVAARKHSGTFTEQDIWLASSLADWLDEASTYAVNFESLENLVPERFSAHWQDIISFLNLVTKTWPSVLAEEGVMDVVAHRNAAIDRLTKYWQHLPPATPVIAAGSTGSIPATARLLSTIARMEHGHVILPGLDSEMSASQWKLVTPTHPQYGLKKLLEIMGVERKEVRVVDVGSLDNSSDPKRYTMLTDALSPAETTQEWRAMPMLGSECLRGIHWIEALHLQQEAALIAMLLRETLQTPEKTAALVTPDRQLARMVAAEMKSLGVVIDDSAGTLLSSTPHGHFVMLAIEMAASGAAPVALLALLKHPFSCAGMPRIELLGLVRECERRLLRGVRLAAGLDALAEESENTEALSDEACLLMQTLTHQARPWLECFRQKQCSLEVLLREHLRFCEWLSGNNQDNHLWKKEAGRALATFFTECLQHADTITDIPPTTYASVLEALMASHIVRPRFSVHPRLRILSPMEARMQYFDRVILAGLNESVWPQVKGADPWMSHPIRQAFGLPPAEQHIGQQAHDFMQFAMAPEVFLTRASKKEGTQTLPSRWLQRLQAMLSIRSPEALERAKARGKRYVDYLMVQKAIASSPPLTPPAPLPPPQSRPVRLSVSDIELLQRDPYSIYAKHILKLRPLDALDQEPEAAHFGNIIHKALELFVRAYPCELPANPLQELLRFGNEAFLPYASRPAVEMLWKPRFKAIAEWFVEIENIRRVKGIRVLTEQSTEWVFSHLSPPFRLTARIDRLEITPDGGLTVSDYKTGHVPEHKQVIQGPSRQLPLGALAFLKGSASTMLANHYVIEQLEYWKLAGRGDSNTIIPVPSLQNKELSLDELLKRSEEELLQWIVRFQQPDQAFYVEQDASIRPNPEYHAYSELERYAEWGEA